MTGDEDSIRHVQNITLDVLAEHGPQRIPSIIAHAFNATEHGLGVIQEAVWRMIETGRLDYADRRIHLPLEDQAA